MKMLKFIPFALVFSLALSLTAASASVTCITLAEQIVSKTYCYDNDNPPVLLYYNGENCEILSWPCPDDYYLESFEELVLWNTEDKFFGPSGMSLFSVEGVGDGTFLVWLEQGSAYTSSFPYLITTTPDSTAIFDQITFIYGKNDTKVLPNRTLAVQSLAGTVAILSGDGSEAVQLDFSYGKGDFTREHLVVGIDYSPFTKQYVLCYINTTKPFRRDPDTYSYFPLSVAVFSDDGRMQSTFDLPGLYDEFYMYHTDAGVYGTHRLRNSYLTSDNTLYIQGLRKEKQFYNRSYPMDEGYFCIDLAEQTVNHITKAEFLDNRLPQTPLPFTIEIRQDNVRLLESDSPNNLICQIDGSYVPIAYSPGPDSTGYLLLSPPKNPT